MLIRLLDRLTIHEPPVAYTMAATSVAMAAVARLSIEAVIERPVQFLIMFPAVVFSAMSGGIGPGLFATVLATFSAWYVTGANHPPFTVYTLFVLCCLLVVWMAATSREAARRLKLAVAEKDLAFRELNHRVGNIAQVVKSFCALWDRPSWSGDRDRLITMVDESVTKLATEHLRVAEHAARNGGA